MHRTTIPAAIGAVAAVAVFGPFFAVVDASTPQSVVYDAPGVHLEGRVEADAFGEPAEVSCGEEVFVDASDAITSGDEITGIVAVADQTLRAQVTEIQIVRQHGAIICVDAEGTLHDGDDVVVGTWQVRPGADGVGALTVSVG